MKKYLSIGRYLAFTYVRWFVTLFISIIALVALIDLTELLRQASSRPHVTAMIVVKLMVLRLPLLMSKLTPFIVLFSTCISLWKLNNTSELTVLRAAGMSMRQILLPLLLTVCSIGFIELLVFNPLVSIMAERYERIKAYQFYGQKKSFTVSQAGMWVSHANQYKLLVINFKGVDLKRRELKQVMLLTYDDQNEFHTRYHAETLKFMKNDQLRLIDGWSIPRQEQVQKFDQIILKNDLDMSIIQNSQPNPETISFWQLPQYIKWSQQSGLTNKQYLLHWHSLMSQVLLLVAMVLLAGAFSFRPPRQGGILLVISTGLSIGFISYILRDIMLALGAAGTLPPLVAAWLPSLISFLCGAALVIYQEDA